jgi:hypothetical protein
MALRPEDERDSTRSSPDGDEQPVGKVAGKRPNQWSKQVCPDVAAPYRLGPSSQMDKTADKALEGGF